jgi:hypothetical protein
MSMMMGLREDIAFVLVFSLVLVFLGILRSGWGPQPVLVEHDIPAPDDLPCGWVLDEPD